MSIKYRWLMKPRSATVNGKVLDYDICTRFIFVRIIGHDPNSDSGRTMAELRTHDNQTVLAFWSDVAANPPKIVMNIKEFEGFDLYTTFDVNTTVEWRHNFLSVTEPISGKELLLPSNIVEEAMFHPHDRNRHPQGCV